MCPSLGSCTYYVLSLWLFEGYSSKMLNFEKMKCVLEKVIIILNIFCGHPFYMYIVQCNYTLTGQNEIHTENWYKRLGQHPE